MSWFRIDDKSAFHRKVLKAGNEAWGAVCRAGAVSSGEGTDGIVTVETMETIAPMRVWDRAVKAGLVDKIDDSSYQLHDYLQWNESAAEVAAKSAARRAKSAGAANTRWGARGRAGHAPSNAPSMLQASPKQCSGHRPSNAKPMPQAHTSSCPSPYPDPDPKIPHPQSPPPDAPSTETPPPASGGGGGEKSDMRWTIAATMASIPVLAELGHAAGVEALAAAAVMAGRTPEAVADAIRHLGVKAATGGWSRNRIEGALSRAVQFAKLPESRTGDPQPTAPSDPPPLRAPTAAEVARAEAAIEKRRAWLVALSSGSQATTPAKDSQSGLGGPKAREQSAIPTEPDDVEAERASA